MNEKHTTRSRREILAQIEQIPVIVEGKLSERRDRNGKRTGHKLQRWRDGRNQTLHIASELVDTVHEGTKGYNRLNELTHEYVQTCEREVLGKAKDSKKKPMRR